MLRSNIIMPGLKIKQKKRVLFQIDTSGSMGNEDVKEAFVQIYHCWRSGVGIDVLEVDASVHRVYPYKGRWDGFITGRGGSLMSPGIEYFNKYHKKYTTMVIFTDGYIEAEPVSPISGKKILWLVSSNGQIQDSWPGHKVKIVKQ